jgi:hypothetical protein
VHRPAMNTLLNSVYKKQQRAVELPLKGAEPHGLEASAFEARDCRPVRRITLLQQFRVAHSFPVVCCEELFLRIQNCYLKSCIRLCPFRVCFCSGMTKHAAKSVPCPRSLQSNLNGAALPAPERYDNPLHTAGGRLNGDMTQQIMSKLVTGQPYVD